MGWCCNGFGWGGWGALEDRGQELEAGLPIVTNVAQLCSASGSAGIIEEK